MKRHGATPDDMADLLHHRATVGGVIWAALLIAACIAALLDDKPVKPTPAQATAVAVAVAASAAHTVRASSGP